MEQTPPPVDLSRLKGILGNAKKMMNIAESNNFTRGHVDGRALNEDGIMELQNEGVVRPVSSVGQSTSQTGDYTEEDVRNSNLPPIVKEAMIKNKIPKVSMASSSFSLNDVSELVEKPMGFPKTPKPNQIRENIISNNSDMITVSRSEISHMITEGIAQFFKQSYDKSLTEDAIKKTINLLIKEGKINVKKK